MSMVAGLVLDKSVAIIDFVGSLTGLLEGEVIVLGTCLPVAFKASVDDKVRLCLSCARFLFHMEVLEMEADNLTFLDLRILERKRLCPREDLGLLSL